jgi:probable F420-dependent oxidoreductase
MTTIDLGPTGAVLSPGEEGFAATAGELERIGYSTIWLTGGTMEALSQVADAVAATDSARIATGIIPVDRFPSEDVAALYERLEADAPGRFVVGLGGAHGADPLGTLNAYLDRLDGTIPPERRVMAALGPKMMGLARDRAAGAFPVLVTPDHVRQAKATLPDTTLAVEQLVVLDTDPASARATARGPLGFLGQVPAYQSSFRRMGFTDNDIAELGDALVDGLVAWGDAAAVADRVATLRDAGADHVAISIVSASPQPSLDEWRAVAEALGR